MIISKRRISLESIATEIDANTATLKAKEIHKKFGRIPYGSPIYLWEVHEETVQKRIIYIGQTIQQRIQTRFEGHAALVRLLTRYVNDSSCKVFFKLCTRMDIVTSNGKLIKTSAIEHFNIGQAKRIIEDVEAYLIYKFKPEFNSHFVTQPKKYWKTFKVDLLKGI